MKHLRLKYLRNLPVINCRASQPEANTVTRKIFLISLASSVILIASPDSNAQAARVSINIVGSSTVYPFTTTVAEQFGRAGKFKTPKVESTGTGGGIKLFCNGVGPQFPDIANASRRIKASELQTCAQNGIKEVVEIKVGYDGIVLAHSKKASNMKLTRKDVFLALAKQVPDPANPNTLIANPHYREVTYTPAGPIPAESQQIAAALKGKRIPVPGRIEINVIEEGQAEGVVLCDRRTNQE